MGNPLRKENLGGNMTGGHGAVPYFNAFMNPFMKGKPVEKFQDAPPMPPDIKREAELRKREELEKLEEADIAGKKITGPASNTKTDVLPTTTDVPPADTSKPPATDITKQADTTPAEKPPVVKLPEVKQTPKPQPTPDKPEGTKPKGKKGDG